MTSTRKTPVSRPDRSGASRKASSPMTITAAGKMRNISKPILAAMICPVDTP
ncbi:Uncharacterised protein [Mycobacteroides abscessus subsp. abscessus]|nr:Uncharacterised protein [Mycobacteroides abscessus subsp. abscessus]